MIGLCAGWMAPSWTTAQPTPTPATPPSSIVPQSNLDAPVIRDFAGTRAFTRPSRDAIMGFSLPTQVLEVVVKGGQEVKAGDLLVRGDDKEDVALLRLQKLRAETELPVKRAKATMDLADLESKRVREAFEQRGATPQELDRARLSLDGATIDYQTAILNQTQEAIQVDRLQARLDRMRLAAPFDGQVDLVHVDVGQAVSENEKVVRVVNVDALWLDVPASMRDPATLSIGVGDRAWVLVESGGRHAIRDGKVIEVSPVADPSSRTRRVRVEVPNPKGPSRLVAGEPAWVRFTPPPPDVARALAADRGGEEPGRARS